MSEYSIHDPRLERLAIELGIPLETEYDVAILKVLLEDQDVINDIGDDYDIDDIINSEILVGDSTAREFSYLTGNESD